MWSDESKFLQFGSQHHHVRRPQGMRYNTRFTTPTTKRCASVMVWGCFAAKGRGGLYFLPKCTTMNAAKYRALLQWKLPDWMTRLEYSHFQHDNAPCHTAKTVTAWLTAEGISVLRFPPNSPDLNPIENLWNLIKNQVAGLNSSSMKGLQEAIMQVWCTKISADLCRTLTESMPKRIDMVLKAKGKHCKY